jgi:hypothetical protein
MLTGKTSVYIDTLKSDDETGDVVPTDDSVENEADDNKIEVETGKKKKLDRSKYGKFILHYGKTILYGDILAFLSVCTYACKSPHLLYGLYFLF